MTPRARLSLWSAANPAFIARWLVLLALCGTKLSQGWAAEPASPAASPVYDYAKPRLLTGTLYGLGSDRKKVLFTFRRTATPSGAFVHVLWQFFGTNGTLAADEKVLYESNRFVSYQMQDFRAKISGAIRIEKAPRNPAHQDIFISCAHGLHPAQGRLQALQPDTVIDDTLYPFVLAHWSHLMRGQTVKLHFVALNWERTFKFAIRKTGASVQDGQPVVQLTMRPTSFFIALFVKPIRLTMQQKAPHHVLSYVGRTVPRIRKGKSWKFLDAETVFDYAQK